MNRKTRAPTYPQVPVPPHPLHRRESLPSQRPKAAAEDPEVADRVQLILDNFSYKQADRDVNFLNIDAIRGVRLQIDYQKAEFLLEQHNIKHTIVVFGSTRIAEPATARAREQGIREQLVLEPESEDLRRRLEIAQRITAKSHYYEVAREFARLVGKAGQRMGDGELAIMTGGGPGLMEAANRGAWDVGSKSIGLNISLPHEQFPNPYITPGLCFQFHYFALRKLHFLLRTRALVAFPGGYGTFDELFETLTLVQTRKIKPVPIILVGKEYWQRAFNLDFMIAEGVIDAEDRDLFWYAETAQEIWDGILAWHELNGEPLVPDAVDSGDSVDNT